jgi:hypothetical protein
MTTLSTKRRRQMFIIDSNKDCQYCNMWKAYGCQEDNAALDKISVPPGSFGRWNVKECNRLLKLLYLDEISIKEFKEMFTEAGMDYNQVEHCCGCAGCYESKTHTCPDFDMIDDDLEENRPDCKIADPIYCNICNNNKERGKYGVFLNKDGKRCVDDEPSVSAIWLCEKHFEISEKQLESDDGTSDDDVLTKHIGT